MRTYYKDIPYSHNCPVILIIVTLNVKFWLRSIPVQLLISSLTPIGIISGQVVGRKPRMPMGPASLFTEPQKLVRHCEVTAILVLYGLTRLLTGSILAHELMHAWLRLDGTEFFLLM
jgi:hypothetical protein